MAAQGICLDSRLPAAVSATQHPATPSASIQQKKDTRSPGSSAEPFSSANLTKQLLETYHCGNVETAVEQAQLRHLEGMDTDVDPMASVCRTALAGQAQECLQSPDLVEEQDGVDAMSGDDDLHEGLAQAQVC